MNDKIEFEDRTKANPPANALREVTIKAFGRIEVEQHNEDALKAELSALKDQGPTEAEEVAAATAGLIAKREEGLRYPSFEDDHMEWPIGLVAAEPRGGALPTAPDPWPVIVSLHFDELLVRLKNQIAERHRGEPPGLTLADKKKRIAELRGAILKSQRRSCAAIWKARAEGLDVPFRRGTSPIAILGIE